MRGMVLCTLKGDRFSDAEERQRGVSHVRKNLSGNLQSRAGRRHAGTL